MVLRAVVHEGDVVFFFPGGGKALRRFAAGFRNHALNLIAPQRREVGGDLIADHGVHHALFSENTREGAGINPGDAGDVVLF